MQTANERSIEARNTRHAPRKDDKLSIAGLQALPREDLRVLWADFFNAPPPKHLSTAFQRRFIAFELQARWHGGLTRTLRSKITRSEAAKPDKTAPQLRPGSRLLREWNGVTHVVDVVEDGFQWNGTRYRSLSAIARAITGAHWSGPRFFGLDRKDVA